MYCGFTNLFISTAIKGTFSSELITFKFFQITRFLWEGSKNLFTEFVRKGIHLPRLQTGSKKGFWNLPLSSTHALWAMVGFNSKIFVLHSLGWPSKIRVTRALSAYGKVLVTLSPNNNGVLYEMKL